MTSTRLTIAQRTLTALVRGYRLVLSPWLGSSCRFTPTCSAFSLEAIEKHGAAAGTAMTLHRLARCHPFCAGGHDPVPPEHPLALRRRFFPGSPQGAGHPTSTDKTSP